MDAEAKPDRINRYTCNQCRQSIVTKDVDEGVTPFMIGCQFDHCGGMMTSSFYMVVAGVSHTHEFYKANGDDDIKASIERSRRRAIELGRDLPADWADRVFYEMQDHCARGGLLLRKREGVA